MRWVEVRLGDCAAMALMAVVGLCVAWPVDAQARGNQMFVCTDSAGVRTYQNSDGGDGCVPLNLNPITVVPSPPSANRSQGRSVTSSSSSSSAANDQRQAIDFNARDDRMKILQEELRIEESKLRALEQEYKGGEPDRQGNERNYQKYLDRVARLEQEILLTTENINILRSELIRLSQ